MAIVSLENQEYCFKVSRPGLVPGMIFPEEPIPDSEKCMGDKCIREVSGYVLDSVCATDTCVKNNYIVPIIHNLKVKVRLAKEGGSSDPDLADPNNIVELAVDTFKADFSDFN